MAGITKEEAIQLCGGRPSQLARALGVTPQAINDWAEGENIPHVRYMQLRYELYPTRFTSTGKLRKRAGK